MNVIASKAIEFITFDVHSAASQKQRRTPRYNQHFANELKATFAALCLLVNIVAHLFQLKAHGRNRIAPCPAPPEASPHFKLGLNAG